MTPAQTLYEAWRLERGGVADDGTVIIAWDDVDSAGRAVWEEKAASTRGLKAKK